MPSRTHPPGPKGALPGLAFLSFTRDPLAFLTGAARGYGDVVYFGGMSDDFYLLNHPDHVKDVLVTHHRSFKKGPGFERAQMVLGQAYPGLSPEGERRNTKP